MNTLMQQANQNAKAVRERDSRILEEQRKAARLPILEERPTNSGFSVAVGPTQWMFSDLFKLSNILDAMMSTPPLDFYVENLIPHQSIVPLLGASGSGKSLIALDLAIHLALGRTWLGHATEQSKVLYVNHEMSSNGHLDRFRGFLIGYNFTADEQKTIGDNFPMLPPSAFTLTDHMAALRDTIMNNGFQVIILDSYTALCPGMDQNDQKNASKVFMGLRNITNDCGCSFFIIHHTNRDGKYSGSHVFRDQSDNMINVTSSKNHILTLKPDKVRYGDDAVDNSFSAATHFDNEAIWLETAGNTESKSGNNRRANSNEKMVIAFLQSHNHGIGAKEIAEGTGIAVDTVRHILNRQKQSIRRLERGLYVPIEMKYPA